MKRGLGGGWCWFEGKEREEALLESWGESRITGPVLCSAVVPERGEDPNEGGRLRKGRAKSRDMMGSSTGKEIE